MGVLQFFIFTSILNCVTVPGSLPSTTGIKTTGYYNKKQRKWWYFKLFLSLCKKSTKTLGRLFFVLAEWLTKFPFHLSFSVYYRHLNIWQIDYRLLVLRVFEKNEAWISSILKDKHNIWPAQFIAPIKTFIKATVSNYCKDWCQYHSHYDHVFILLYTEKLQATSRTVSVKRAYQTLTCRWEL